MGLVRRPKGEPEGWLNWSETADSIFCLSGSDTLGDLRFILAGGCCPRRMKTTMCIERKGFLPHFGYVRCYVVILVCTTHHSQISLFPIPSMMSLAAAKLLRATPVRMLLQAVDTAGRGASVGHGRTASPAMVVDVAGS